MKKTLEGEFERKCKLKGTKSSVKQARRLIKEFFVFMQKNYPEVTDLESINYDHKNAYYKYLISKCQQGVLSKYYLQQNFYDMNKFFKAIERRELCYNVTKIIGSIDGKKKIYVTKNEYESIKKWRRKYGEVLPPE